MTDSFTRYERLVGSPLFDAIVIGSGISGLGVAAILARHGKRVLVLERHYTAGGMTHTFHRPGFEWDTGVHYLGKVHDPEHPLRRVFDYVTEGKLRWARMAPVYDRLIFPERSYDLTAGAATLEDTLAQAFPSQRRSIAEYLRLVQQIERSADRFFLQRVVPRWLAPLTHPLLAWPFLRHSDRTTGSVLRSFTSDARLCGVLAGQWANYAVPPAESSFAMHALVASCYLEGGNYPEGGGTSFVRHIAPVIERAGGRICIRSEVEEILVRNGQAIGVRLAEGSEVLAPCVISSTGAHHTLGVLLPQPFRTREVQEGLRSVRPGMGHICLYLGLEGTAPELGLEATNLWVHAGYDHDASLRRFCADPSAPLPLVFVSSSARDPQWESNYPGRSTLSALCPVPYGWFERWEGTQWRRRGQEYEDFKGRLAQRLLEVVYQHLPRLRGKVRYQELSTPLSTQHFGNRARGAIYGLEHTPARFRQAWLRPGLSVRNLFLTGQDVVSVGVGASMMSAVLTACEVLRRNVLGDVLREPVSGLSGNS